jgi:DNA-directed RNA polymerase subunit E'/Rpb7
MNIGVFDGTASFLVKYEALVCNPVIGDIIECQVSDTNKAAINAFVEDEATSPLNIFMARQHHVGNTEFFALKKGDIIKIKIVGKTYNYRDTNILVFGQFISSK